MADLIDREKLLNQDEPVCRENGLVFSNWFYAGVREMIKRIETAPTAEACAHWICTDETFNVWRCSSCGEEWTLNDGTPRDNNMHYCFNCGALIEEYDCNGQTD